MKAIKIPTEINGKISVKEYKHALKVSNNGENEDKFIKAIKKVVKI